MESDIDSISSFIFNAFLVINIGELLIYILLLLIMLLISAMMSGSEIAYFSIGPSDKEHLKSEGKTWSDRIIALLEKEDKLLATVLVFNNLINIGIVLVSDHILSILFSNEYYLSLGQNIYDLGFIGFLSIESIASIIRLFITVICVTILLVLFGEVIPKVYAKFNYLTFAKVMSNVLTKFVWFFSPITNLLVNSSDLIERKLSSSNGDISVEEMDAAIKLTIQGHKHDKADFDILKAITQFGDVSVKQIMSARVDIIAISSNIDFIEVMNIIRTSGFSRIPVYKDNIDHIFGILYVKDFIKHIDAPNDFKWIDNIRKELLFVPESKKIDDLLNEFQELQKHMAIVVDEFGGCSGLVTLDDIMEEIVGDIKDEFQLDSSLNFKKIDDFIYEFDGKTLINDFCKLLTLDIDYFDDKKGDADSLAGLVLEHVGFFPKKNQVVTIEGFLFKILELDKRRIINIKVTIPKNK